MKINLDTLNPKRVLRSIKASDLKDDSLITITEANEERSFFQDFLIRADALASNFSTFINSTNVGSGAGVFKQNNAGTQEFRSIVAGDNITVTENENDITLNVPDKFVNSVELNGTTLRLNRSEGLSTLEADLSPLISAFSDGVITSGSFDIGTGLLTIVRTAGLSDVNIDLSALDQTSLINALVDQYVDSISFTSSTNILTLGRTGGLSDLTVNLSSLAASTDTFVSSATFSTSTNVLTLSRNDAVNVTVDLSHLENPGLVSGFWVLGSKTVTLTRDGGLSNINIPLGGVLSTDDINDTFISSSTTQAASANRVRLLNNRTNTSDLHTRNTSIVNFTTEELLARRIYGPITITASSLGNNSFSHRVLLVGQIRFNADDNTDDTVRVRLEVSTNAGSTWSVVSEISYISDGSKDWIHPNIFGPATVPAGGSIQARIDAQTTVGGLSRYSTQYYLQAFSLNVFE